MEEVLVFWVGFCFLQIYLFYLFIYFKGSSPGRMVPFPLTQLGQALLHGGVSLIMLPRVWSQTVAAAVQCCSHHRTFPRRQMFLISLLDLEDFYPAEGLSFPPLCSQHPMQAGRDTVWCQHPI